MPGPPPGAAVGLGFDGAAGAGLAAGAGAAAGAGFAAGAAGAGFAAGAAAEAEASPYQVWMPWWPRQAPDLVVPVQYVPSLHCPVALAGFWATAVREAKSVQPRAMLESRTFIRVLLVDVGSRSGRDTAEILPVSDRWRHCRVWPRGEHDGGEEDHAAADPG